MCCNQIDDYLSALSSHTGDTYRLPTSNEAKALHKSAKKAAEDENTLVYWAGYTPTSREIPLLMKKLEESGGDLIMNVGRFNPVEVGDAEVYDLGGNVAERSQSGTYGFSAYQVSGDSMSEASSEYVGFRVVKE